MNPTPSLLSVALLGIAAPASAVMYIESGDNFTVPGYTITGFNPLTDTVQGSITGYSDASDAVLFELVPNTAYSFPISIDAPPSFYSDYGAIAQTGGAYLNYVSSTGPGSVVLNFTSPADGKVRLQMGLENVGTATYTIGAPIPEPATTAAMAGGAAVVAAALLRRRKLQG